MKLKVYEKWEDILTPCQEVKWGFSWMDLVYTMARVPSMNVGKPRMTMANWWRSKPAVLVLGWEVGCNVRMP